MSGVFLNTEIEPTIFLSKRESGDQKDMFCIPWSLDNISSFLKETGHQFTYGLCITSV